MIETIQEKVSKLTDITSPPRYAGQKRHLRFSAVMQMLKLFIACMQMDTDTDKRSQEDIVIL